MRKALVVLEEDFVPAMHSGRLYQRLPVRLFIASMASYDPIWTPDTSLSNELLDHYIRARSAVRQRAWADAVIQSSADYLRMLFEDDGQPMESQAISPVDHQDFDVAGFVNV